MVPASASSAATAPAFAEAIAALLAGDRAAQRRAARARAEPHDWETVLPALLGHYRRLLDGEARPRLARPAARGLRAAAAAMSEPRSRRAASKRSASSASCCTTSRRRRAPRACAPSPRLPRSATCRRRCSSCRATTASRRRPSWSTGFRLRSRKGDELALHGWSHRDEKRPAGAIDRLRRRVYTRGEGEFWALSEREATGRIEAGLAWFREHGFAPPAGFVAPGMAARSGAWDALATQRFEYTATLRELVHLPGTRAVKSQSVVYSTSSGWRRQSLAALERGRRPRRTRQQLLRLELHPRDADFADIRRSWQKVLAQALRDRRAVTSPTSCATTAPARRRWCRRRRSRRRRSSSRRTRSEARARRS
jgi:predicted deacetylase